MSAPSSRQLILEESPPEDIGAVLPTHIEAIANIGPLLSPLSDQELVDGGMAPVHAWMKTQKTKNAIRAAAAKSKKELRGIKQLNLEAPIDIHGTLRAVAKASIAQCQRIDAILAPAPPQTEADLARRRRLSFLSRASPEVLAEIDAVLRKASNDPSERKKAEVQARKRDAMTKLGVAIASLPNWRRWVIQRVAGLANQQMVSISNGRTQ